MICLNQVSSRYKYMGEIIECINEFIGSLVPIEIAIVVSTYLHSVFQFRESISNKLGQQYNFASFFFENALYLFIASAANHNVK